MARRYSRFGTWFTRRTGALQLMEDLGVAAQASGPVLMLGGGNPARIAEVEAIYRRELARIAGDPDSFGRFAGAYSAPEGDRRFRTALAGHLSDVLGSSLDADHVALTPGSQAAFFLLFNLLAGQHADSVERHILLPVIPEYIGYTDLGLTGPIFAANRPRIDLLDGRLFKYRVDFEQLQIDDSVAAICVSRPTNPTGNVLTDGEITRLDAIARSAGVPLIVDSAYGLPFPGIVFGEARPFWNENVILCLSLSKIGLPGVRTGIVVAAPPIIDALRSMLAVMSLAPPSTGAVLVERLLVSGELERMSRELVQPYYRTRVTRALEWLHQSLEGVEYRIHRPEGAFFLWLWLPTLPISSATLYERLKARGVYVIPGESFFPGLGSEDWPHQRQCLRISYAQAPEIVERGMQIVGEEVRRAFGDEREELGVRS